MPIKTEKTEKTVKPTDMSRAVGRRKTASARVRITPGKGAFVVNAKEMKVYFPTPFLQQKVTSPFTVIGKENAYDVSVKVVGGGPVGQAEAVRHGITRALVLWNPDFRPALKAEGFLTRDPRARERKKPGKRRARRGHQWKKR